MNTSIFLLYCILAVSLASTHLESSENLKQKSDEIILFYKGFLDEAGFGYYYDKLTECIDNDEVQIENLNEGFKELKKGGSYKKGFQRFKRLINSLIFAFKRCKIDTTNDQFFEQASDLFNDPAFKVELKSVFFKNMDVGDQIFKISRDSNNRDYEATGRSIAKIVLRALLGRKSTLDEDAPDWINENNPYWKAKFNPQFKGLTLEQLAATTTGTFLDDPENSTVRKISFLEMEASQYFIMPSNFDSRYTWPTCISAIRNQGSCGGCWAIASSQVLSDRFCIKSKQSKIVNLSPQYQLSCDATGLGCRGGYILKSWKYLETQGTTTESCVPYTSSSGTSKSCSSIKGCSDSKPMLKYRAVPSSSVKLDGVSAIQQAILDDGPVEAAMSVYEDLYNYNSGIYYHYYGNLIGGHAVRIIGWGYDSRRYMNYWIVANSWGTSWGENGYFNIAFGQCGIENNVYVGQADLTSGV